MKNCVYFDNAATTFPKPRSTVEAAGAVFTRYGGNPGRGGHPLSIETSKMVYRAREELCGLLGFGAPENAVFTLNCTQALNMAIKGCLRQGDHAVISGMEHNSVYRPVDALAKAGIITYDVAAVDIDSPARTIENFRALMRPETRLVCCVHGSNVFGTLQPAQEICAMAHRRGALFLLDAAQTAGVADIDLSRLRADFTALACHKGLYAPTALGALVVGCPERLETILEGGSGSLSLESAMPPFLPDRLEAGTVNTTGIAGLLGGLRFVRCKTPAALWREEMEITDLIFDGLHNIGRAVLYNRPQLPVLSFGVAGMTGEQVANALAQRGIAVRGGFHCSPLAHRTMGTIDTGTARVGVGAFNTLRQGEQLVRAVEEICRQG